MFYKQFLEITDVLNKKVVEEFDYWLTTLPRNNSQHIRVSTISSILDVQYSIAEILVQFAYKKGILKQTYLIICPNRECELPYETIDSADDMIEILGQERYCHNCENTFIVTEQNVIIEYKRIYLPDVSEDELREAILKRIGLSMGQEVLGNFCNADSLQNNLPGIYTLYYSPDESAYIEMEAMKQGLDGPFKCTKEKGDVLERLALYLFKQIRYVTGTNEIRTYTNQLDCTMKFPLSSSMFPTVLRYMTPYFIIECKNEDSGPSNTYFHKISSIMAGSNAILGIVVSRHSPGQPARDVAREAYLENKGTYQERYLISLSDADLDKLIDERKNLLEYIDWKILSLTTNGKNSTFEMFELESK